MPPQRRLRLGKLSQKGMAASEAARTRYGSTVVKGDLIVVNCTSWIDAVYAFMRFGSDFAVVQLPSGSTVQYAGLFGALARLAWTGTDPTSAPCNGQNQLTLNDAVKHASARGVPLVCFAEGVRTNGKSVIPFAPVMKDLGTELRIHVLGLEYSSEGGFAPQNPVGSSAISYLFWLCFQPFTRITANLVPHELRTVETERTNQGGENAPLPVDLSGNVRATLAMSVGNRGVKQTSLGIDQYFAFVEYYLENATLAKSKKKRN